MKYSTADIQKVPEIREVLNKAKKQGKGLFIHGMTGTGKTYALYAIEKSGVKAIGSTKVGEVENWVEMLAEMRNNLSQSVNYAVELTKKEMVIIDDLGAEKHTDWSQEMLYLIVNRMYLNQVLPIIATNLTLEQFQEKYGDRIFSRFVEMCEFVELTGDDKRLPK